MNLNHLILKIAVSLCLTAIYYSPKAQQLTEAKANEWLLPLHVSSINNADSAISICDSVIHFSEQYEIPCLASKARAVKSRFLINSKQFEDALQNLIQSQKLDQSVTSCDSVNRFIILLNFSFLYSKLGDNGLADSIARNAISEYNTKWQDQRTLVKLYLQLGSVNDDISIVSELDSALRIARKYEMKDLEQKLLISIGAIYAINDDINVAKNYMNKALKVAISREAYSDLGMIYNNLAGLSEDLKTMLTYVDSALYYAEITQNLEELQLYTENKAYLHTLMGDYKKGYNDLYVAMTLKDSLLSVKKYEAVTEIREKYEAEKKSNQIKSLKLKSLNANMEKINLEKAQNRLLIGGSILILAIFFLSYRFVILRKNRNTLAQKNEIIEKEKKRSEELLLNILPEEIAQELKVKGNVEAKHFDIVSILFTDLIEFTKISEKLSTQELIKELNFCFEKFDQIIQKYSIEKIKTIGDSYMAAGGLPIPNKNSVKNTVLAALEMQEFMKQRKLEQDAKGNIAFDMRAGIHTGPVVAGIVGVKKFQYDVWGDTVNTASRLETTGSAEKVNISQTTYEEIKDDPEFKFEPRGLVDVKGKGKLNMFFVSKNESLNDHTKA